MQSTLLAFYFLLQSSIKSLQTGTLYFCQKARPQLNQLASKYRQSIYGYFLLSTGSFGHLCISGGGITQTARNTQASSLNMENSRNTHRCISRSLEVLK